MSKILKHILFRIVLVIITLHAIIPHPHSDKLTAEKHVELHQKSHSLFGIIRFVFHESDDETLDNLTFTEFEGAKKIDSKNKYSNAFWFPNIQWIVEKTGTKKILKSNTNNLKNTVFVKLNGLRGPPSLV